MSARRFKRYLAKRRVAKVLIIKVMRRLAKTRFLLNSRHVAKVVIKLKALSKGFAKLKDVAKVFIKLKASDQGFFSQDVFI